MITEDGRHVGVESRETTAGRTHERPGTDGDEMVARFPGTLDQVAAARRHVTWRLGDDHPCHDTAELLTGELAANAVQHTASGHEEGGSFLLTVTRSPTWARVMVTDAGADTMPCVHPAAALEDESGRGMLMVAAFSLRWGITRADRATTVWFEIGDHPAQEPLLASPDDS